MTDRNIYVMDLIVSEMVEGTKLSKALQLVYYKRNVNVPYNETSLDVLIMDLKLSNRATNALRRAKLKTLGDVIEFCNGHKITDIKTLGINSGVEIFEAILDYSWDHMSEKERVAFLIDTVENNKDYIREGIA